MADSQDLEQKELYTWRDSTATKVHGERTAAKTRPTSSRACGCSTVVAGQVLSQSGWLSWLRPAK